MMKKVVLAALLLLLCVQAVDVYYSDYKQASVHKKGLTFTTTVWPE